MFLKGQPSDSSPPPCAAAGRQEPRTWACRVLRDFDSGARARGSGFRVQVLGFRVQVVGFRVQVVMLDSF